MFSRRIAGCCRRVLPLVLVSVLLVSACTSASEEVGEGGGPPGAGTEVPVPPDPSDSPSSPPGASGGVLEDVFTAEELEGLREVFTDEELESMEGRFSGEELEGWFGSGGAVWGSVFDTASAGKESSRVEPRSRFEAFSGKVLRLF